MRSIPGVGSWQFPVGWWTWLEKRQPEQKTRIRSQILVGPTKQALGIKCMVQYSQHFIFFITYHTNGHIVEQLTKYQRAARMPALQCFILDLEKRYETCANVLSDAKCCSCMLKKKCFVQNLQGWRDLSYWVITVSIKDWLRQESRSVIQYKDSNKVLQ
jgi:hypothetical protein